MKQQQFGARITMLRNVNNMTQKELAEACNVDIRTIQRIEAGEVAPRKYTVKLLAKALKVEVEDLNDTGNRMKEIQPLTRVFYIAGIIFTINYIPVIYQVVNGEFGFYIHSLLLLIYIGSFIFLSKGFYHLGKQSNNQVLASSALLSMVLLPLLNLIDLFKFSAFAFGNASVVFTAVCINAIFFGIGLLMESNSRLYLSRFYKIAGVITFVQTGLFLSLDFDFITVGLVLSAFCNVLMTYILYHEVAHSGKPAGERTGSPELVS
jgi:transcriptional regulator with XRE-family HTH domain